MIPAAHNNVGRCPLGADVHEESLLPPPEARSASGKRQQLPPSHSLPQMIYRIPRGATPTPPLAPSSGDKERLVETASTNMSVLASALLANARGQAPPIVLIQNLLSRSLLHCTAMKGFVSNVASD